MPRSVSADIGKMAPIAHPIDELPDAIEYMSEINGRLTGRRPAVFLDYDGTMTPIVEFPDLAVLAPDAKEALERAAAAMPVAVISGRDVEDVRDKVGVEGIYYAGSHGFDVIAPDGSRSDQERAAEYTDALAAAGDRVEDVISSVSGAWVERKRFAVAIHYRQVSNRDVAAVAECVSSVNDEFSDLRCTGGKKIFEFRPDFDWDKGKALVDLLRTLGLDGPDVVPFYIGDDLTDEDALRELVDRGIGIIVAGADHKTLAEYSLSDTAEVTRFLDELSAYVRAREI